MVSLRFYGGIGEIGGNKILLEDGGARVWLDFGQSFTMGEDFFAGWLQPRRQSVLRDLFEFDLMPRIRGLYSEGLLEGTGLGYEGALFEGVFLSHAHSDHVGHIGFVDQEIPVYLGEGTRLFMEAMEKTSGYCDYGEHDYRCFRTGDCVEVGELEVEPIHVDHSIPAAYGFIIHTSEGVVVYTGDMRAHGPRWEMTEEFLEAAAQAEPVAMIAEGTRMAPEESRRNLSETEVLDGVRRVCGEADAEGRMVLYTHGPRDMDRLRTFYTASVECGRSLVVSPKTAHLLGRLVEDEHLDLPDPLRDDRIGVYFKRKRSGRYEERDYFVWEREFLDRLMTPEDLRARPRDFLVHLDFYSFAELVDIRPEQGTPFVYSMSEAFDEEDLEERVMHNWLGHFGLRYHQLHASGHMSRAELEEAVRRVSPRMLFPVHTEHPELFRGCHEDTIVPALGTRYEI
jgi:ribonuclease J